MNRKPVYILLAIIALVVGFWNIVTYENNPERLFSRFNQQLREEKFEEIYDESDSSVKNNVSKEEFIRRMTDVVKKLKEIDPNLNFQKDSFIEQLVGKPYPGELRYLPKLENEKYGVSLIIYWNNKGIFPKFTDLKTLSKNADSERFVVYGVSYKYITYEDSNGRKNTTYHY